MKPGILLPFQSEDPDRIEVFNWVKARWYALFPDIQIYELDHYVGPYSRATARNRLAQQAINDGCEILIFVDADTVCPEVNIRSGLYSIENRGGVLYPFKTYWNMGQDATRRLLSLDPMLDLVQNDFTFGYEHRIFDSPGGIVMVPTEHFIAVGGYDSEFVGWGFEDDAFRCSLSKVIKVQRLGDFCLHLWHPIAPNTTMDSPTFQANEERFRQYESCRTLEDIQFLRGL